MENGMSMQDLLNKYDCESVLELYGYIEYLEGVKEDHEYMKERFKSFVNEIDELY